MASDNDDALSDSSSLWSRPDSENSESEVEDIRDARAWCRLNPEEPSPPPPRFPFSGSPGIQVRTIEGTPLEWFNHFFTDDLVDYIVSETNRFAEPCLDGIDLTPSSRAKKWTETTREEMRAFVGLLIYQGIVRKPSEDMYWSTRYSLSTPFVGEVMSHSRFVLLMRYLHLTTFVAERHEQPRLKKVFEIFKLLCQSFQSVYCPDRDISIDESLIPFKGRLGFKQYMPCKRARFGIKFFELCEAKSGYIYNIIIYTGKDTPFDEAYSSHIMIVWDYHDMT